jgi:hypothetical protein
MLNNCKDKLFFFDHAVLLPARASGDDRIACSGANATQRAQTGAEGVMVVAQMIEFARQASGGTDIQTLTMCTTAIGSLHSQARLETKFNS